MNVHQYRPMLTHVHTPWFTPAQLFEDLHLQDRPVGEALLVHPRGVRKKAPQIVHRTTGAGAGAGSRSTGSTVTGISAAVAGGCPKCRTAPNLDCRRVSILEAGPSPPTFIIGVLNRLAARNAVPPAFTVH